MRKRSVLKNIVLAALSVMLISTLYSFIRYKESFDQSIWMQVIMASCFLITSINNFRVKNYVFAWIFAGAVLTYGVSIFWLVVPQ